MQKSLQTLGSRKRSECPEIGLPELGEVDCLGIICNRAGSRRDMREISRDACKQRVSKEPGKGLPVATTERGRMVEQRIDNNVNDSNGSVSGIVEWGRGYFDVDVKD